MITNAPLPTGAKILQRCATEGEECLCSGDVYYSRNMGKIAFSARIKKKGRAVKKHVSANIICSNEAFGRDPAPWILKSCYCAFEQAKTTLERAEANLPPQVDSHVSALVRDHMLPISEHVFTEWGDISLVRAAKVLFNRCYSSGAVKCVLLSEADVPIRPFDETYAYLTAHNKSHLDYARVPAVTASNRWTQVMMLERFVNNVKRSADFAYNIDVRHFTFHSMWMALSREHTKIFVDDNAIFQHFETGN